MRLPPIDPTLFAWAEIEGEAWPGLLVGNGGSLAMWERFAYGSLLAVARERAVSLSDEEHLLFEALDTENFEHVLQSLGTASLVNRVLGISDDATPRSYKDVQQALIRAVQWVHPPWRDTPAATLGTVRKELLRYEAVYSTNYDLLLYWAVMVDPDGQGFADYFWRVDGGFDPENTVVLFGKAPILYLHGGIHLQGRLDGGSRKRLSEPGKSLLETFEARSVEDGWLPLFISEGTSREKEVAIARSDYLSFANDTFAMDDKPLVIFGHSLGDQDAHLVQAIRSRQQLAVSVMPGNDARTIAEKGRFRGLFPEHTLVFFDATTHPLGHASLRISPSDA